MFMASAPGRICRTNHFVRPKTLRLKDFKRQNKLQNSYDTNHKGTIIGDTDNFTSYIHTYSLSLSLTLMHSHTHTYNDIKHTHPSDL